ncbi:chorismate mutase [uncultured Parasphingopyxis sp.]|mgnify:CR=1 FL=1|uniref:chorismate mutase n=1 Tax=uncultured Parasphingopyxis sp. TaxID=1547918 RepID=UPI002625AEE1|nr:chorismate mutase [uncultured Parasphingopyxis sp.]
MTDEPDPEDALARWRDEIDTIDAQMIRLLAERFKITTKVGYWKAANDVPPVDPGRERRQVERLEALAEETGLSHEFLTRFLRIIIDEVVRHHRIVRGEEFDAPDPL